MSKIEDVLKKTITPDLVPDENLNSSIIKQAKEFEKMKRRPFKTSVAAAAIIGILVIGSVSVYAAYRMLSASDAAEMLTKSSELAEAFKSDEAVIVNETQCTAGYKVTFMGLVTGENMTTEFRFSDTLEQLESRRTYAVVAIENEDGSPMPSVDDVGYKTFCVSPLIKGKTVVEADVATLKAFAVGFVQDGVQYQLLECDNLEIFSGMGVWLGVFEQYGEEMSAFNYDDTTGNYSVNKTYKGVKALFELPLDKSKADDKAANEYLERQNKSSENTECSDEDYQIYKIDEQSGLPMLKEERCTDENEKISFFFNIYSILLSEEQISEIISYGTLVEEEIIEEKDGYFEGTYKNEEFRKPADYYDEGETDFYFVSTDSEHMTARWIHKDNGELTLREYNFNSHQVEELYDYYH